MITILSLESHERFSWKLGAWKAEGPPGLDPRKPGTNRIQFDPRRSYLERRLLWPWVSFGFLIAFPYREALACVPPSRAVLKAILYDVDMKEKPDFHSFLIAF